MTFISYKWTRFVLLTAVILVCMLAGAWIYVHAGSDETAEAAITAAAHAEKMIDVGRGDTLWGIAKQHLPQGENISSYIYKIKQRNGLQQSTLQEGQLLILP